MAVVYMYACAIVSCIFFVHCQASRVDKSSSSSSRLRLMVSSLQEQIIALQKEQENNRQVIKALENRLDSELMRKINRENFKNNALQNFESERNANIFSESPSNNRQISAILLSKQHRRHQKRHQQMLHDGANFNHVIKRSSQSNVHSLPDTKEYSEIYESLASNVNVTDNMDVSPERFTEQDFSSSVHQIHFTTPAIETDKGFSFLDKKLKDLQEQLSTVVRDTQIDHQNLDTRSLQAEWESLRDELQKLRQELQVQKSKREQEWTQITELKSGQVTTKWLQKSVEDVRREMSELAVALNISMALQQSQQLETMLNRVRSDMVTLRSELERQNAGRARQNAAMEELKEELEEVRLVAQTVSMGHQQLTEEVSAIKEELFGLKPHIDFRDTYLMKGESSGQAEIEESDGSGSEMNSVPFAMKEDLFGRRFRHSQYVEKEIAVMKQKLHYLQRSHAFLDKELHFVKRNYSLAYIQLNNMQKVTTNLANQTSFWIEKQSYMVKDIEELKEKLIIIDERTFQNSRNIINITEAVTGMDKVHSSTVQLFEALESLEAEYSKKITDLQKDVSKFEFNVAQVQSAFDILRQDHSSHYMGLKALKEELSILQTEVHKDHNRLLFVENEVLNHSLYRCSERGQETLRDLKLANIELRLAKIAKVGEDNNRQLQTAYAKLMQKVDRESLRTLLSSQKELEEEFKNISSQLKNFHISQLSIKQEMLKFVQQLPSDCSMSDVPNPAAVYGTGIYLIHVPEIEEAQEVFCDMSTVNSRWTVIQRRSDGSEDFFRNWTDYKSGFGNPAGEFWLGNDIIHKLTNHHNYTLRIDMWDVYDRYTYAEYKNFRISSEEELYRLDVGAYSGNASDALKHHHNMAFSTKDRDNDASSTHCAMYYSGGWWYQHCQYVNVNGRYSVGMTWYDSDNHEWVQLAKVEMKIHAPLS